MCNHVNTIYYVSFFFVFWVNAVSDILAIYVSDILAACISDIYYPVLDVVIFLLSSKSISPVPVIFTLFCQANKFYCRGSMYHSIIMSCYCLVNNIFLLIFFFGHNVFARLIIVHCVPRHVMRKYSGSGSFDLLALNEAFAQTHKMLA